MHGKLSVAGPGFAHPVIACRLSQQSTAVRDFLLEILVCEGTEGGRMNRPLSAISPALIVAWPSLCSDTAMEPQYCKPANTAIAGLLRRLSKANGSIGRQSGKVPGPLEQGVTTAASHRADRSPKIRQTGALSWLGPSSTKELLRRSS